MSKTIEVRGNIVGDILKIRHGVIFQEETTVIDELFQNAQRAKAEELRVNFNWTDYEVTLADNGVGCKDPQAVFEKSSSAWDNEDEAFGEGFFSVFLLADWLRVESHNWMLEIDVLEMLETKNLEFNVTELEEPVEGFKVHLKGERIEDCIHSLESRAKKLGKLMVMDVYVNDNLLEKKGILELEGDDKNKFSKHFSNSAYEATLAVGAGFSTVDLFYERRPVDREYTTGINGKIHFNKGAVTLKAPDRKSLIYDAKRDDYRSQLRMDAQTLYTEFLDSNPDNYELSRYDEGISEYLSVNDYLPYLKLDKDDFDITQHSYDDAADIATTTTYRSVAKRSKKLHERVLENVAKKVKKTAEKYIDDEPESVAVTTSEPKRDTRVSIEDVIKEDKKVAWITGCEVDDMRDEIAEAEYHGFSVIVAKNRLYENAFKHLEVPHLKELHERAEKVNTLRNAEPKTKKEERFLTLMGRVEDHFGLEPGTIQLADLGMKMTVKSIDGTVLSTSESEVLGRSSKKDGHIYIDRSIIDFPGFRAQKPDYPNITYHDIRVVMQSLETLGHELSHFLYGTKDNTQAHFSESAHLMREIAGLF